MTISVQPPQNPALSAARAVARPASASELRKAAAEDPTALQPEELFRAGMGGGAAYAVLSGGGPGIYAHELGHAVAASLVHQNANPRITVNPFQGGVTRYSAGPLTELGQKLGPVHARALVAGAGTLVDATSAAISFAAGYRMRKEHPILGPALMGYGALTMANSVLYAGSALFGNLPALAKQGHDFAALAVTIGLPPLASVAILGALLPAEYLLLKSLEKHGL